ncbi:MAG: Gfo/Idh/MocA family oxidoreductase [Eubacteriales bacterium]|nr:Gfo/Idh/MocA family oxidoreductase [Eubacteriales bacterium]
MKRINWGIIGTGNIVRKFAKGLSSIPEEACLYGVGSRTLAKAEEFAKEYGVLHAYGSYEELAADPEIDVVYIGIPHGLHKECAKLCMEAGKHVLCEKPICLDAEDTAELVDIARKKKVFLMEAMWTKFLPVIQKVKEEVQTGGIGELLQVDAAFGFWLAMDERHRIYDRKLGGGALLDVGIYPITLACYLAGEMPKRIQSSAIVGKTGVDEVNAMLFEFSEGKGIATLRSAVRAEQGSDAWIYGTEGKIWIPHFFCADRAVVYGANGSEREIAVPHRANGYEYEAMAVDACIREGKTECEEHTLAETIEIMKLMDGLRKEWGVNYKE